MKIKVSDYIAQFLVDHGILDVFTVTGGGAMHMNDSLGHKQELHCTYNHHEQGCAIAAEAYCRLTNRLAAVCVTSGPGGTNALTGVVCGWLDSIPMFILSGQVKRETTIHACPDIPLRQLGDQEFDITTTVKNMTKYSKFVDCPEEIAYHLEKALYLCKEGRGGPVWLDLPLDVQASIIETNSLKHFTPSEVPASYPAYNENYTNQIIEKIKSAKRPVILAGTGIRLSGARDLFIAMVEKLKIPVVTAWNAHDVIWDEHPLYCGRPGTQGNRGGNFVVQNSDLLIVFGCRLNIRQISYSYEQFAKNAYKIIIEIDEAELHKPTVKPDLSIHANLKDVVKAILDHGFVNEDPLHKKWVDWCRKTNEKYPIVLPEYREKSVPMNPYVFLNEFSKKLSENEVIVTSNGSACVMSFQAFEVKKKTRLFTNSGCATMGYGLPGALGVAVALKGERVICIEGDGSLQMNIQELQTIIHNQLNIKIFVLNNEGYHSMRQTQTNLFGGKLVGVSAPNGVSFPSLEKIAFAYGYPYFRIESLAEIEKITEQILGMEGAVICEVMVDNRQFFEPKLSSKVLPNGKIVSPEIDDLYPFLSREEYASNKISD